MRCPRQRCELLDRHPRVFQHAKVVRGVETHAQPGRVERLDQFDEFIGQEVDVVLDGQHDPERACMRGRLAQQRHQCGLVGRPIGHARAPATATDPHDSRTDRCGDFGMPFEVGQLIGRKTRPQAAGMSPGPHAIQIQLGQSPAHGDDFGGTRIRNETGLDRYAGHAQRVGLVDEIGHGHAVAGILLETGIDLSELAVIGVRVDG